MKTVLVVHTGALGDVVLAFPVLIEWQRNRIDVDLACQPKLGRLARELGIVKRWLDIDSALWAPLYTTTGRIAPALSDRLRAYDRIVVFSCDDQAVSGLRRIGVFDVVRIAPRPPRSQSIHAGRYIRQALVDSELFPDCPATGDRRPRDPSISTGRSGNADGPVVLHPGSGSPVKNWPLKRFVRLSARIERTGVPVRFVLGPAESGLIQALAGMDVPDNVVSVHDEVTDLLAVFKTARAFVGNDSGLTHLAAFIGLPTVAIFGPSDPVRWAPAGPAVRVVTADRECGPCFENRDIDCPRRMCLENVSVSQVMTTVEQLLPEIKCLERNGDSWIKTPTDRS